MEPRWMMLEMPFWGSKRVAARLLWATAALASVVLVIAVPAALGDPPVFSPPPPNVGPVEATSSAGATVNYALPTVTDDNPNPSVVCTPASGSTFAITTTTVNCTATDATDSTTSTASFTVTVHDTTPPTLNLPGTLTISATGPTTTYDYSASVSANDIVSGAITPSCSPAPNSAFPLGPTTINCTATDGAGNTASGSFQLLVVDTTPPVLQNVPANIGPVQATGPSGASVTYTPPTATDAVDPSPTVACDHSSGTFALGTTTVTCTAKDASGNQSSASFTVTVVDTTPPTLQNMPSNIGPVQATGPGGASVSFTPPTATDTVDPSPTVACDHSSGTFGLGTTTVTCTATDASGNHTSASFTITVVDTQAPTLSLPGNLNVNATGPTTTVSYSATANDNVDGSVPVTCTPSGNAFPVGVTTVNCTATDSSHNTASGSFTVTVVDNQAPVLILPANITIEATGPQTPVTYSATANDNVNGPITPACSPASGTSFGVGTVTVSCSATDSSNNKATGSFTITVTDTTAPSFSGVPGPLKVEANGPSGSVATYATPTATDLVDGPIPLVNCSPASGSNFPLGSTTVDCSAQDSHHNVAHTTFQVNVVDTTPPVLTVPNPITTYTTSSDGCPIDTCPGVQRFLNSASATDLVDPHPKVYVTGVSDVLPIGVTPAGFHATDFSGNTTAIVVNINVVLVAPGSTPPPPTPIGDVTPPPNVTDLSAKAGNGSVTLVWTNPTKDFAYVIVYRSDPSAGGLGSEVYKGAASKFRETGLTNGVTYRYVVVTYDKSDNRSVGVAILVTPAIPMLIAPADGAVIKGSSVAFRWKRSPDANYFNFQLFFDSQVTLTSDFMSRAVKVLSAWPRSTRYTLKKTWRYAGRTYRLKPGLYRWFVWPGFGTPSDNKYGPLLGQSTFRVKR